LKENELRRITSSIRSNCPEGEVLIGFVDHALPPADADCVEQHLLVCGLCAHEAVLLRQSLNADLQEPEKDTAREERMRDRFHRFLEQQERAAAPRSGLPRWLAGVAAAVVLLLLYPAHLGLRQMLPRVMPAANSAHIVRLDPALRNATQQAPVIRPDKNVFYLGLMFFVPIPEPLTAEAQVKLDCRLQRGGRVVYATGNISSFDGLGNFLLMIPLRSLEAGPDYVLTVMLAGNAARAWQFPFFLETHSP
jgi:hypothetical protein